MSEGASRPFAWPVRVYFHDTDAGGIVFHGNYLHFMEAARTEFLQSLGYNVAELQRAEDGVLFVVYALELKYRKPARLHDSLQITVAVQHVGGARLIFEQRVVRDGETLVSAQVSIATVHPRTMKPVPVPERLRAQVQTNS
ncbi:MAG TPA: tol-pal system-associated acyl-CoA thioesterase [Burkholderiales bacterium]|nr:tol-pal system-associated acyl-CoA thioesterase [Burkholderiales bacterium]